MIKQRTNNNIINKWGIEVPRLETLDQALISKQQSQTLLCEVDVLESQIMLELGANSSEESIKIKTPHLLYNIHELQNSPPESPSLYIMWNLLPTTMQVMKKSTGLTTKLWQHTIKSTTLITNLPLTTTKSELHLKMNASQRAASSQSNVQTLKP